MEVFIKEKVIDVPKKQTLLSKLQGMDAEIAILSKSNSDLVANARLTRRTKKQLPTEAQYLSKETAEAIRAKIIKKEAEEEAKKAQITEKKAIAAARKAVVGATAASRQLANVAMADKGPKKRLPPRSRAKENYLLRIKESIFD